MRARDVVGRKIVAIRLGAILLCMAASLGGCAGGANTANDAVAAIDSGVDDGAPSAPDAETPDGAPGPAQDAAADTAAADAAIVHADAAEPDVGPDAVAVDPDPDCVCPVDGLTETCDPPDRRVPTGRGYDALFVASEGIRSCVDGVWSACARTDAEVGAFVDLPGVEACPDGYRCNPWRQGFWACTKTTAPFTQGGNACSSNADCGLPNVPGATCGSNGFDSTVVSQCARLCNWTPEEWPSHFPPLDDGTQLCAAGGGER